jgi:hypothetical protein
MNCVKNDGKIDKKANLIVYFLHKVKKRGEIICKKYSLYMDSML